MVSRIHWIAAALLAVPAIAFSQAQSSSRALPIAVNPVPSGLVSESEVPGLIKKLEDAATRKAAADRLVQIGPESLTNLYAAMESETADPAVHNQLLKILPEVHLRLNAQSRKASDLAFSKWLQSSLEAYRRIGKHDPKWDSHVVNAFNLLSQHKSSANEWAAAVKAGGDDPLIRLYNAERSAPRAEYPPVAREVDAAAHDLDASAYSPGVKQMANFVFARLCLKDAANFGIPPARIKEALDRSLVLFPDFVKEKPGSAAIRDCAKDMLNIARKTEGNETNARKKVLPILEDTIPHTAIFYGLSALSDVVWAWDARGGSYAGSVRDDQWKGFGERLDVAEQDATAGWEADPCESTAPIAMISVCMGKSYPRPVMEKWFQRAILADPNNIDAYRSKQFYLFPKWEGSTEETLAFGRECLEKGTAANRVPAILTDAHTELAEESGNPAEYWTQPGVWRDIDAVYKKLLSDKTLLQTSRDNYLFDRAKYIKFAIDCQQWKDALRLMNEFGTQIDMKTFGGQALYDYSKKKATEEAAK